MTVSAADTGQPPLRYSMLWASPDGGTHVQQECTVDGMEMQSWAPPATPSWVRTSGMRITETTYQALPAGYFADWHHAPGPLWSVVLSGHTQVEATDGTLLTQGPGDLLFTADSPSHTRGSDPKVGHLTRTIGDEPAAIFAISVDPKSLGDWIGKPCLPKL